MKNLTAIKSVNSNAYPKDTDMDTRATAMC